MKLHTKIALITGGGSGLGAAIARRFVDEGAKVCITGRRGQVLDDVVRSLPAGSVVACAGDVCKEADAERMVRTAIEFGGRLDILVNNAAALGTRGRVGDLSREAWQETLDTNLTGPFLMMRAAIPRMIAAGGGSVINVSAVGGIRALPSAPAYCASKAGIIMLTQQAALDYGPKKIRCNVVCPAGIKSEFLENEFERIAHRLDMQRDALFDMISKSFPLQRFGTPSEVCGACTFLASDDSGFVTGSTLVVDAGISTVDVVGASLVGALRRAGVMR